MKILIFYPKDQIKDSGGPSGYLFNLLSNYKGNEIELLPCQGKTKSSSLKMFLKKAPSFLVNVFKILYHVKYFFSLKKGSNLDIDFDKYDIIHFHDCFSYYSIRKKLVDYKGKILLTNHTPTSPQVEMFDFYLTNFEKKIFEFEKTIINDACSYAFKNADYIIYPTLTSDESYYKDWPEYANIIKNKKIITLLTGVKEKPVNIKREDFRRKYNISDNDFVFCYIGRHVDVKGYDTFKSLFDLFKNCPNVKFLIAGKEGPLYGFDNDRWIEVGRTKDSGSVINACDCFVLPNKETYFDIVLLEVLSIGKPIITSYTGGNKYFKNKSEGIFLYSNFDELKKMAYDILSKDDLDLQKMGNANRKLYKLEFTREKFLFNYLNLLQKVYKNEI